jgi:hypothetical protein
MELEAINNATVFMTFLHHCLARRWNHTLPRQRVDTRNLAPVCDQIVIGLAAPNERGRDSKHFR